MTTNEQKMCGFVGLFDIRQKSDALRTQVLKMSKNIRHRGPDWSGVYCGERAILSHERLSIVDPQSGGQPLFSRDGKLVLAVNGEIYNHREIRDELAGEYDFRTGSDCEVILPLYRKMGVGLLEKISGVFRFRAVRHRKRRIPDRPRSDRRHPALYRLGPRRAVLRGLGAESPRRGLHHDPTLPAGPLLVEQRGENGAAGTTATGSNTTP